jgi:hypothetical protein
VTFPATFPSEWVPQPRLLEKAMPAISSKGNLDLRAIPLIDGHCHSIDANYQSSSASDFLRILAKRPIVNSSRSMYRTH